MLKKSFYIKIILLILTFSIAISSLSACKSNKVVQQGSEVDSASSEFDSANEESSDIDESSDNLFDDFSDSDISFEEDYSAFPVSVKNNSEPIIDTFRGSSATVYFCYTFMKDNEGRNYTEEQAKTELDRIQNAGYKLIRTMFKSSFSWSANKNQWDFETEKMKAIYRWARELDKRDIDVAINAPWSIEEFAVREDGWVGEATYLYGYGEDLFGESYDAGIDFTGMDDEEIRFQKSSARIAHWICEALEAFKAHGINNVTHLLQYTEPLDKYADYYVSLCSRLHKTMKKRGIREQYKIMGPNTAEHQTPELTNYDGIKAVLKHMNNTGEPIVDILSAHVYPDSELEVSGDFTDDMAYYSAIWKSLREEYGYTGEFWMDEGNVSIKKEGLIRNSVVDMGVVNKTSPWRGTQFAAIMCRAMENGVSNFMVWNFADQLWPDRGIFIASGLNPCILYSQQPYKEFFAYQMITRAFGYEGGKVYETIDQYYFGVSAACVQLKDGNWVLLVVNGNLEDADFAVDFEKTIGKNMYRHLYTPAMKTGISDEQIPADKGFKNVQTTLKDTIPSGGVAIYTTEIY